MNGDSSWEEQWLADRAAARKRQNLEHRLAALEERLQSIERLLEEQTAALAKYDQSRMTEATARDRVV